MNALALWLGIGISLVAGSMAAAAVTAASGGSKGDEEEGDA